MDEVITVGTQMMIGREFRITWGRQMMTENPYNNS